MCASALGVVVGGGTLTFKIKLVDVFQRLVDKVETSESLRKDKNDSTFRKPTRWNNDSFYFEFRQQLCKEHAVIRGRFLHRVFFGMSFYMLIKQELFPFSGLFW